MHGALGDVFTGNLQTLIRHCPDHLVADVESCLPLSYKKQSLGIHLPLFPYF